MLEGMRLKSAVMLPTFNESKNIRRIINEILKQDDNIIVVVVDDNSPDGTGEIVDEMAKKQPDRVKVLHRKTKGRASAGLDGFKYCLTQGVDCIFEMDADFSHDPNEIPAFLKEMEQYDVVIGSRYVDGGGAVNCPKYGRYVSFVANIFNRFIFGYKIKDNSGGFKCYKRKVLETIDLDSFISKGYSIGAEMLYYCCLNNFSIKEIPITFKNREKGKSKQNIKILFEYPLDVLRVKIRQKILIRDKSPKGL